ncbi:16S rRNA (adenine(1518)-N(6)/adenine(1519)-N(6))-dimethyltransferase RsmA [Flagellimonas taeanensis]|uniref:16S rRNA (adenine(1518)-N(6)/adenine(1519)-N(6))- dimethyltransferase RsmA n=1 Tax=Flavobacteriaceae TaxID=49546 RepID=UPI000E68833C|nr:MULTISPECIES: 16S rRNA (adenine(1518)-N(6)/adenine(1519)-N(6))-dimethyltransferase RsmA [Allomuricauda]MDC6383919.1 16S rRNA (adenine(1518)-N(6)/adenine(1519)-N(6))-dimethyltransferase RsmA [Muricauda sp. SK9]MEE1961932.1 16S rRNA (adenine(1518)-N(6)/adenine(1519)-N(6))-dimethyltransferase RsmA [Allomuricauda taeanensis]RIV48535.1 16S rRNA (adenine(1518)-N(6)/adenine(1519)-N(6))-dimethyltransferase RsmA [Allomuricauda taeanensis]
MSKKKKKWSAQGGAKKQEEGAVRAKKHLGQHFLKDETIAEQIAGTLTLKGYKNVLEIGPGMGVLTKHLLKRDLDLVAMDLDAESIVYLNHSFPLEHSEILQKNNRLNVIEADFLKFDLTELYGEEPFAITGNFPYNISSQIVFKMLEMREQIPEFSGMFQKEVAQRICEKPGSKTYGILSVLVQAFYEAEYLFTVPPTVFDPPPKVDSGVLRLIRRDKQKLACDERLFFKVVKTAFNQRRKTIRNSLKTFGLSDNLKEDTIFDQRPEQLSVADFVTLTQKIADDPV